MKNLIFLFLLLTGNIAFAEQDKKPVVIAVIDTGFNSDKPVDFLCKFGHRDFTTIGTKNDKLGTVEPVPIDQYGHGTNIAGLIAEYAKKSNKKFCLVIIKYTDPKESFFTNTPAHEIQALEWAVKLKVDVMNLSFGGPATYKKEQELIEIFLDMGGTVVAAAGNDGKELGTEVKFYPAMYDKRIVVVGNRSNKGIVAPTSNRGILVTRWADGTDKKALGITFTGTSQATAIVTGKIVGEKDFSHDKRRKIVDNSK